MAQSKKGASDIIQKKPMQRKESATPKSALADIQKCKELGIETHLQANKMRSSYAGHVCWGRKWLASHFDAPSCSTDEGDCLVPKECLVQPVALSVPSCVRDNPDSNVYADPAFKNAFGCMPNRCSDKALALFMSLCHIPYSGPRPMIFPRLPDAHPDLHNLIHTSILLVHASRPLVHYRFGSVHYRTSIYPYLQTSAAKPASSTFGPNFTSSKIPDYILDSYPSPPSLRSPDPLIR
ncbi:hypothetical protein BDR03DRAFT_1012148 [Suillus americanus]|nr:hypothetical protein BDR03DRAFT_1012148 [Suillus americanus]